MSIRIKATTQTHAKITINLFFKVARVICEQL